jgi:hypothetical protein
MAGGNSGDTAGTTVLHLTNPSWSSKDLLVTNDDNKDGGSLVCFIEFPGCWSFRRNVGIFTDQSKANELMTTAKPSLCGMTTSFDDLRSNTSFAMSRRVFAQKYEFEYDGVVYAWRGKCLSCDMKLLQYPAKTEVAFFDNKAFSFTKVGTISVYPGNKLPLHIIAGTLYIAHLTEKSLQTAAAAS